MLFEALSVNSGFDQVSIFLMWSATGQYALCRKQDLAGKAECLPSMYDSGLGVHPAQQTSKKGSTPARGAHAVAARDCPVGRMYYIVAHCVIQADAPCSPLQTC